MKINKLEIIFICSVAAAAIFLFAFFLPASSRIQQFGSEVTRGISINDAASTNYKTCTLLHNSCLDAKKELKRYRRMLPDSSERLDVLRRFEKLSLESGQTKMASLKMLNAKEAMDSGLEKQLFEIMLTGNYEGIARFVYGLTHMDIMITIEKMVISPTDEGILRAKVVAACYFAAPPVEIAHAGKPDKEDW